jgi:hypothetical protein
MLSNPAFPALPVALIADAYCECRFMFGLKQRVTHVAMPPLPGMHISGRTGEHARTCYYQRMKNLPRRCCYMYAHYELCELCACTCYVRTSRLVDSVLGSVFVGFGVSPAVLAVRNSYIMLVPVSCGVQEHSHALAGGLDTGMRN